MTNFSGAVRARAGCGGAGPGRAGEAALGCPDNSVDERLVLKNTPATPGNRGWGWPPASQRFTLPSGVPPPRRSGSVRGGVDVCVCGALPASPPSLSPPRSALIAGRSGDTGPPGGGRLPWCHTSGCPWKYDPMPWPTKKGQTWKPPCRATELRGQRERVRVRVPTTIPASRPQPLLPPCYRHRVTTLRPLPKTVTEASMAEPLLGFRVNTPANRGWQFPCQPCCLGKKNSMMSPRLTEDNLFHKHTGNSF